MSLDGVEKGILTPEGKLLFGYGGEEHSDLREKAGYPKYDEFYNKGGIRFGVVAGGDVKEAGFVEVHSKEALSNAIKVMSLLPNVEMAFDYLPQWYQEGGRGKNKHWSGDTEDVIRKVRAWAEAQA